MGKSPLILDEPITVQKLIDELQTLENKDLPVTLSAPSGYTNYFWLEVGNNNVTLGTT